MTNNKIIQEIHDSYDSSVELLLNKAKSILEKAEKEDTEVSRRLLSLGFLNSKKAVSGKKMLEEKEKALELSKLISKYQQKYPFHKFITMEKVKEINQKYGLICVPAHLYTGDIPLKNLEEIENFKCDEEDSTFSAHWEIGKYSTTTNFVNKKDIEEAKKGIGSRSLKKSEEEPFYISCPPSDVKKDPNYRIVGTFAVKMEKIEDPIVLKPVIGGFLIVSKWGLEAQDPSLFNEKLN